MNSIADIVLIVEDHPDGQELLARMLFRANVPVELTGNAEDSLDILSVEEHSIVIIYLALLGMDGFDLVKSIRKEADIAYIPCLAITAFHTPTLKQKVMQSVSDGYSPNRLTICKS